MVWSPLIVAVPGVDAPPPSWEELENVMLAVKLVVHGLVEFIQNFSKKSHDAPQVIIYIEKFVWESSLVLGHLKVHTQCVIFGLIYAISFNKSFQTVITQGSSW